MLKFLKTQFLKSLTSQKRIEALASHQSKEPVLILGDGISSIYALNHLREYKYIICCNSSILNKHLQVYAPLFYILVDPYVLVPKFGKEKRNLGELFKLLSTGFRSFPNTTPIMHSLGRPFNFAEWSDTKPIFISPYHSVQISPGKFYSEFTASLQASLGMAIIAGFTEIHFAGFDAWLLNPKNNLRWHSRCCTPDTQDRCSNEQPPDFLLLAAKTRNLSVYTYRHYTSRHDFIMGIQTNAKNQYIPEYHRAEHMEPQHLSKWTAWENRVHPSGYAVDSRLRFPHEDSSES